MDFRLRFNLFVSLWLRKFGLDITSINLVLWVSFGCHCHFFFGVASVLPISTGIGQISSLAIDFARISIPTILYM